MDSEPITVGVSSPNDRDETTSARGPRRDDDGWDCIKVNHSRLEAMFIC
jgi:hypothetical protein